MFSYLGRGTLQSRENVRKTEMKFSDVITIYLNNLCVEYIWIGLIIVTEPYMKLILYYILNHFEIRPFRKEQFDQKNK